MSLERALRIAKNAGAEKVPFRFQFPLDTKEEFEELCEKHKVSMTDMILGLVKSAIDEDRGLTNVSVVNIINKIEVLEKEYQSLYEVYQKTGDDILTLTDGTDLYVTDGMEKLKFRIKMLNKELQRRNK